MVKTSLFFFPSSVIEPLEFGAVLEELFPGAGADNFSIFENHNFIGLGNGGKPVGYNNGGNGKGVDGLGNQLLTPVIQCGGGFVQN